MKLEINYFKHNGLYIVIEGVNRWMYTKLFRLII